MDALRKALKALMGKSAPKKARATAKKSTKVKR